MIALRRALVLSVVVVTASCGGSGTPTAEGPSPTSASPTTESSGTADAPTPTDGAATADDPAATEPAPTATEAAPAAIDIPAPVGDPIDPATVDPCSIVTVEEVTAVIGSPVTDPRPYDAGGGVVAECDFSLDGGGATVGYQIDLRLPPGSATLNEPRPFAGLGEITGDPGSFYAIADLNGWMVTLTTVNGTTTEEQLAAFAALLASRLVPGPGSADTPTTSTGDSDGTCTVEVTGGVTDSFTDTQGIGEAYSSYWVSPEQQAQADEMFPGGAPDFQVGCSGGDQGGAVLVSLIDVDVPLGSTEVVVPANQAGYFSDNGIFGNAEPITITLTRFDESGMSGSFTFTGDGLGTDTSTATVTFDFVNDQAG